MPPCNQQRSAARRLACRRRTPTCGLLGVRRGGFAVSCRGPTPHHSQLVHRACEMLRVPVLRAHPSPPPDKRFVKHRGLPVHVRPAIIDGVPPAVSILRPRFVRRPLRDPALPSERRYPLQGLAALAAMFVGPRRLRHLALGDAHAGRRMQWQEVGAFDGRTIACVPQGYEGVPPLLLEHLETCPATRPPRGQMPSVCTWACVQAGAGRGTGPRRQGQGGPGPSRDEAPLIRGANHGAVPRVRREMGAGGSPRGQPGVQPGCMQGGGRAPVPHGRVARPYLNVALLRHVALRA